MPRGDTHPAGRGIDRGDGHAGSDVDIAVYIDEARAEGGAWGYRADLTADQMAALNTNDVDVVELNQAPQSLKLSEFANLG